MRNEYYRQDGTGTIFQVELYPPMERDFQQNKFHLIYELEGERWVMSSYMGIGSRFEGFKERHTKIIGSERSLSGKEVKEIQCVSHS